MMRLSTVDGAGFELRIVGYDEFPDILTKGYKFPKFLEFRDGSKLELQIEDDGLPIPLAAYDANWPDIEGAVRHPQCVWAFRDPCLLADEVGRLADWLERVASSTKENSNWGFIEPNIFFHLVSLDGIRSLRVSFSAEAKPWRRLCCSRLVGKCLRFGRMIRPAATASAIPTSATLAYPTRGIPGAAAIRSRTLTGNRFAWPKLVVSVHAVTASETMICAFTA